jgi:hypothetical protein
MGALLGALELFDGFSAARFASAVVAGAIFWSIIGVFVFPFGTTRIRSMLLCAGAGALAGAAWGAIRASNILAAVFFAALAGGALGYWEYRRENSSPSGAA